MPAIAATCATLLALLVNGATVKLAPAPNPCPPIAITGRTYNPPVTIDATGAALTRVDLNTVSGIIWHGGEFSGTNTVSSGFAVTSSDHVALESATLHNYLRNNISFSNSSDFRITNNVMSHSGADGIDIALSRRGLIDGNVCSDPDTTTGSHPDCVQLWSRPTAPPVADIAIVGNTATGAMQGFNGFNHVRPDATGKMVNDGGFDRITVVGNTAAVSYPDGIYFTDCRSCVFFGNHFVTPKGAAHWTNFVVNGVSTGFFPAADQTFEDQR